MGRQQRGLKAAGAINFGDETGMGHLTGVGILLFTFPPQAA